MRKILFDVGANYGTNSLKKIQQNKEWTCFAFEPTPKLIEHLLQESKNLGISDRYHIIPKAVSDYDGDATFNIAGQADWGCSSLLEFSENLDKTWPGRTDFKVTEKINVEVICIKTFIEQLQDKITTIDYFHCDTQGNDLKVLYGMGEYINFIKEGVIETANDSNVQLYKNQHTKQESIEFLKSNGFEISKIEPNDNFGNEFNIYFINKQY